MSDPGDSVRPMVAQVTSQAPDDHRPGDNKEESPVSRAGSQASPSGATTDSPSMAEITELAVAHDPVNSPSHYTSSAARCSVCGNGIECIDVTRHLGFNVGNAMKYLWRLGLKGDPIEQLEKAIWYLNDEVDRRVLDQEGGKPS